MTGDTSYVSINPAGFFFLRFPLDLKCSTKSCSFTNPIWVTRQMESEHVWMHHKRESKSIQNEWAESDNTTMKRLIIKHKEALNCNPAVLHFG